MNYTKLDDKELYARCVELSYMIKKYRNQFIALLPEVNRRELYRQHGFLSIYEFAAKLACLSNKTVQRVLKLKEDLKDKPVLNEMFENGTVGWSKIKTVTSIATIENEKELAAKITTMSNASVEVMVRDFKQEHNDEYHVVLFDRHEEYLESFPVKLHTKTMNKLRVLKRKLEKENKQVLSWEEAMEIMIEKLQEPIKETRKAIPLETNSRYIPAAMKREVLNETHELCAKCNRPYDNLHHQKAYSECHNHNSIIPLCKPHHDAEHHKEDTQVNKLYQEYKRRAQEGAPSRTRHKP